MNTIMVAQIIQAILAPAVMINGCAILVGALYARHLGINDRLRNLSHERLELLFRHEGVSVLHRERLREIDFQLPGMLRRHRLTHVALVVLYVAICVFVADMFTIAFATATSALWAAQTALVVFLGGICVMLISIVVTLTELRTSRSAVVYEVERVMALTPEDRTEG